MVSFRSTLSFRQCHLSFRPQWRNLSFKILGNCSCVALLTYIHVLIRLHFVTLRMTKVVSFRTISVSFRPKIAPCIFGIHAIHGNNRNGGIFLLSPQNRSLINLLFGPERVPFSLYLFCPIYPTI